MILFYVNSAESGYKKKLVVTNLEFFRK